MGFWQRLWKTGANHPVDEDFDPDVLLQRAQLELNELHAKNRERAVHAITQKNNLQQMVDDIQKRIEALETKAELARQRDDVALEEKLRREADSYRISLATTSASLEQAIATSEQVKQALRREEDRLRNKAAEALALRAQWKTTQVQRSLLASLVEVNAGLASEVTASERVIRHARNRRLVQEAIVQRNNLRALRDDTDKRVNQLRESAKGAGRQGNDSLENQLLREMEQYEATLAGTRDAVMRAEEVTERAIGLLKEEEETLRSLGFDPHNVSEEDVALYEARLDLANAENDVANVKKRRRTLGRAWAGAIALAVVLIVMLLFLG